MSPRCAICGTPAEVWQVPNRDAFRVRSSRASGDYDITGIAAATINNGVLDEPAKAKLTTMLIEKRLEGIDCPSVDSTMLEEIGNAPILTDTDRAEGLLGYIVQQEVSTPGRAVSIATRVFQKP